MLSDEIDLDAAEKLAIFEQHCAVGSWTWHLRDQRLYFSPQAAKIFGIDPYRTQLTMDLFEEIVHPEDLASFGGVDRLLPGREVEDRYFRVLVPDGTVRWVRMMGHMRLTAAGVPDRVVGMARDVTDERRHLEAFEQQNGLLEAVRELFNVVVWKAQADGTIASPTEWWQMTGHVARGTEGWGRLDSVHPDDRENVREAWRKAIRDGRTYEASARVSSSAGQIQTYSRGKAVRDVEGRLRSWIGITTWGATPMGAPRVQSDQDPNLPTAAQVRAARGLLGMSATELADHSGLSFSTIRRIETPGSTTVRSDNLRAVRQAFEKRGVRFVVLKDGRRGVALRDE